MVDEAWLNRQLEDVNRQLRELPPSVAASFAPVVANLQATIIATIQATYSTTAQMNAAIANPGTINPTNVNASGSVVGATGTFNGGLNSTSAYSHIVTTTRVTNWTGIGGDIGTAPSDENVKTSIVDSMLSSPERAELILEEFQALHYQYKAELAKRDDPDADGYVGSDYQVHTELGSTAQRVHALGLWEVVVYDREPLVKAVPVLVEDGTPLLDESGTPITEDVIIGDQLKLDSEGNPYPIGLHYELFGIVAIAAAQYLYGIVKQHTADIAAIKEKLGM